MNNLKIEDGSGFCSCCEEYRKLMFIITNNDPIGFCEDCKKILIEMISRYEV